MKLICVLIAFFLISLNSHGQALPDTKNKKAKQKSDKQQTYPYNADKKAKSQVKVLRAV